MTIIVSTVFHIILFPLDGKVVIVDQLSFCTPYYSPLPSGSVPLVGGVLDSYVSIDTSLLKASSIMGYFPLQPLKVPQMVNMASSIPHESTDPWILPALLDIDTSEEQIMLLLAKLAYQAIQSTSETSVTLATTNGTTAPPITASSFDPLNQVLPTDESIIETMSLEE